MIKRFFLFSITIAFLGGVFLVSAQQPAFNFASIEQDQDVAIFAGGCFWCMEPPYDNLDGVVRTISGYTGGTTANPTYRQVVGGGTGHYEAVLVVFEPERITYEELLRVFWVNIDPLDDGGQFCDRGDMYRSGIFYRDTDQRRAARESVNTLEASGRLPGPIVTEILQAGPFYIAEDYHQEYYRKNPLRYRTYRMACGRDARLQQLWGSDSPY